MEQKYHFNDRSMGIFADGYKDRNGVPVGDTFASSFRAKIVGFPGINWTNKQKALLIAMYSSQEMAAIMDVDANTPHIKVEFDLNYFGGDYSGTGDIVLIPVALVDAVGGDVHAAFEKLTRYSAANVVYFNSDEQYNDRGTLLEDMLDAQTAQPAAPG